MSSIQIRDLRNSTELDANAMATVRGGFAWNPDVKVNLNVDQKIVQVQDIDLNVMNNNKVIGAGFAGPSVSLDASLEAGNSAVIPKFF